MRRISVIVMALSTVLMIFTGIVEALPRDAGLAGHHIAAASLFFIAVCFFAVVAVVRLLEILTGN